MAIAPIRPLAWEPLYAVGAALEKTEKKKGRVTRGRGGHLEKKKNKRLISLSFKKKRKKIIKAEEHSQLP